jgi:hypothetical protein
MSICPCSRIFTKELILPIWTAAGEHKSGLKALLLATPRCWQSAILRCRPEPLEIIIRQSEKGQNAMQARVFMMWRGGRN